MNCVKCEKNYDDVFFSKPEIESYNVWVIRKEKGTGKFYAVDMSAALCHSCVKEGRMRQAKGGLVIWLIISAIVFLCACTFFLLAGGRDALLDYLTFPYILVPLMFFLLTPLTVWIRYRHPTIPRTLILKARIGKDPKTWTQLGYGLGAYSERPTTLVYDKNTGNLTDIKFEGDEWKKKDW